MKVADAFVGSVKNQRLAWTCAIVIGLVLIYRGVPTIPVLLGCTLALLAMGTKLWPFRTSPASRRTK